MGAREPVRNEPGGGRDRGRRRPGTRLAMTLAADPVVLSRTRQRLGGWLSELGWPNDPADDVVLAVSEAVSNALEHAYRGPDRGWIHITAEPTDHRDGARVVVRVTDHGQWRPAAGPHPYRGHGIKVMSELMDRLEFQRGPAGTTVTLTSRPIAPLPSVPGSGSARGWGRLLARPSRRLHAPGDCRRAADRPRAARALASVALAWVTRARRRASRAYRRVAAALRVVFAVFRRTAAIRPMRGLMAVGHHADARITKFGTAAVGLR
jgi:anti-sigma regulatory factor (Ser/Thr protein kinase)